MNINTLFVSSSQNNAGSIIITMGLMQLLKSKIDKVAFYRPVVEDAPLLNHDIRFMIEHFSLEQTYEESFGIKKNHFESLLAEGKQSDAIELIIANLEHLKSKNEFVLIEGIDPAILPFGLGFEFNVELSKNLDSDFILIVNAKNKNAQEILNEITIDFETLKEHEVRSFMNVINRIAPNEIDYLQNNSHHLPDLYFMPEVDELDCITIKDIHDYLDCELLFGKKEDLNRIVTTKLIAAMSSEHYLERLSEKALIVVPSDRSDIITATILGLYSKNIPNVAGIILTGNLKLSGSIERLLKGLDSFTLPILSTAWDTYQSVVKINEIKVKISPDSSPKIALAMGLFFDHIDAESLLSKLNAPTQHSMTPAMFQYTLFEKARNTKKTIVLPESEDERILRACEILLRRGVANIILLGDREEILHRSGVLGLDLSDAQIIDPNTSDLRESFADELYRIRKYKGMQLQAAHDAMSHGTYFGTMLVYKGLADGMVSGASHTTADTVRPALQIIKTAPGISIVSSVFFMCLETQVLVYGDCAVNQNPDENELAQIAVSSAKTAQAFGIEPRVAMLSYSTGESGTGEDVEKVKAATRIAKTIDPSLLIEGPIQYDAAIDSHVASIKLPHSDVAGKATVFIFPDLNTGNNTYKAVQRSSGAIAIGPVLQGLNKPINDLSRGCLVEDIVNTVAITAIQAGALK
ncbi:phosphate acetyltransferase [Sulfuricurvum sp.]|uniref:phosphate acetyltransferase n=1 Tax=Sulfuricurvum sp. TaxID=2025608 RepID=UPI002D2C336C|nr:phosphate acetyltransferase [Sulfuricurvum sp.]HZF70106.1 phosphate acetyltransferase [Sulfuricurvum sp.]